MIAEFAAQIIFDQPSGKLLIDVPKTMREKLGDLQDFSMKKNEGWARFRIENLEKIKTYPQLKRLFAILRKIYYAIGGEQWGLSEAEGIDKLKEGMLCLAAKEFGYPYVMAGQILIPKALSATTTFECDLVHQTLEAFAATHGIDISKEIEQEPRYEAPAVPPRSPRPPPEEVSDLDPGF